MTSQTVATCNKCNFTWVLRVEASAPSVASVGQVNQGNRCPFCQSNSIRLSKEQITPT